MPVFYWDDLIESIIRDRNVVPVIGLDLWDVKQPGGEPPFYRELVVRTIEKLRASGLGNFEAAPFPEFVAAVLPELGARTKLTRSLSSAHTELLAGSASARLPEPLRQLSAITDFPLILTCCIDGLAARAFGVPDNATLNSTLSEIVDLAPDWQPSGRGDPPTLVHLFGRIAATPGFALTEEDTLEMMWNLQGDQRPSRLLSRLRRSHVLVLGTRFPDWLARFFLRLMRGARLSVEGETFEAIADPEVSASHPLVSFLKPFNPQMRIYDEGSAADFVRELHNRWCGAQPARISATNARSVVEDLSEPDEMGSGSLFISYASEDRAAATTLADILHEAGIDVWFDRNELRGGDRYAMKIRSHIHRCSLFVPLMSHNTEVRQDAFFRREWTWARERLPAIGPERPFMIPVVIDDYDAINSADLAHYFEMSGREVHILTIPHGAADSATVMHFIHKVRQLRTLRVTTVA
jgi:TIR domain-containing protein